MYVLREKEACTHIEEKRNKLQTYMQVDMCGVRPCSRRERDRKKENKLQTCKQMDMCGVIQREKNKLQTYMLVGTCGVRLCTGGERERGAQKRRCRNMYGERN